MPLSSSVSGSLGEDVVPRQQEPLTPGVRLASPRSSSFSTPGTSTSQHNNTDAAAASNISKFTLLEDASTPLQRSTQMLGQQQHMATAPPFLRGPTDRTRDSNTIRALGSDLTDLNLALGALDLDFGGSLKAAAAAAAAAANVSTMTVEQNGGDENALEEGSEDGFGSTVFGGGGGLLQNNQYHQQSWQQQQLQLKPGENPHLFSIGAEALGAAQHHSSLLSVRPFDLAPMGPLRSQSVSVHQGPSAGPSSFGQHDTGFAFDNGSAAATAAGLEERRATFHGIPSSNDADLNSESNIAALMGVNGGFGNAGGVPPHHLSHNAAAQLAFSSGQQHPLQSQQIWPPLGIRGQSVESHIHSHPGHAHGFGLVNGADSQRLNDRFLHPQQHPPHHFYHNGNSSHGNGKRSVGQRKRGEDASKYMNSSVNDFKGEIHSLCKDQHGCRFLQRQLDIDPTTASLIFEETQMHIVELMIDPFGNYLVQKLLEKVNSEQLLTLIRNASAKFISIALDPHGTRALQKLVECISTDEQAQIVVRSLSEDVVNLSRDLNGNHVIQKCLQVFKPEYSQFIFDAACKNCLTIATHRHGCCVLQRCLDHGSEEQCKQLSLVISDHALQLALDAFGNYVVQYVLSKDETEAVAKIISAVKSDIIKLSLHKFGSNVIEKCLRVSNLSYQLIDELLKNENELTKLLNDPFGNYVLQTSLDAAKGEQFTKLSNILKPLLPQVRNTPHGRRLLTRLQHATAS